MIKRAEWAWGEASDAEDEGALEAERFLSQSGGRSPARLAAAAPGGYLSRPHSAPGSPRGRTAAPLSGGGVDPRAPLGPRDVDDYEMMKALNHAKRRGERLMAGSDVPRSAAVQESLNRPEGAKRTVVSEHQDPFGIRKAKSLTTTGTSAHSSLSTQRRVAANGNENDDDLMSQNSDFGASGRPTPWMFDSDNSADEDASSGWGTAPRAKRTRRPRQPPDSQSNHSASITTSSSATEPAGTRTITRLSPALQRKAGATQRAAPQQGNTSTVARAHDPAPWESQIVTEQPRHHAITDRGGPRAVSNGGHSSSAVKSVATPYARHERQHLSNEAKQAILKHSAMSLHETTVPTVANAEALAVVSRQVVRGSAGGGPSSAPLWNEYNNPSTAAQLAYV